MPIDPDFTLRMLQSLVRIDSRNPELEAGAPGEREIAAFVARELEACGWTPRVEEVAARRFNVVADRRGRGDGPSLMINGHLDTVGTAGMTEPFSGELRDGRVHGRGAQDTKGGLAAMLAVARALHEDDVILSGDVQLAFVADEEHGSLGTSALLRGPRPAAAIVLEPTELDVCIAHRGFAVFRVRTEGRTAHGGRTDVGIDANRHLAHVLAELDTVEAEWRERHRDPLVGEPALHIPRMEGGRQLFFYAGEAAASVECRTVPGQTREEVEQDLRAAVARVRDRRGGRKAGVDAELWRSPYAIDPSRPVVQAVTEAAARVRGAPPAHIAHPWWEDSGLLGEAGVDTVILGPRGDGLHTDAEWVDAESVADLARILLESVESYCGVADDAGPSTEGRTR